MPYVEEQIYIAGDIDAVYAIARDMEKYPQYMTDVESVTVLERNGDNTVTEWVTDIEGTPIIWTEVDEFDHSAHCIRYRLIEGDLDKFEGEWRFERVGGGTLVVLGVDYDFGIPNLTELIGPTLDIKVRENSQMMLRSMKQHVEKPDVEGGRAGQDYAGPIEKPSAAELST